MDTTDPASPNYHACNSCKHPASEACSGCIDASRLPDGTQPAFYCSRDCHTADRDQYKQQCNLLKERKHLYRAASLTQEIYYIYREFMNDRKFVQLTEFPRNCVLVREDRSGREIFVPFSNKICTTMEYKKALLTYLCCSEAITWMHDLVQYIFGEMVSSITELHIIVENPALEIFIIDDNLNRHKPEKHHNVYKLDMQGEAFILDYTGGQYGYFDTVVPYTQYFDTRLAELQSEHPLGDAKEYFTGVASGDNFVGSIMKVNEAVHVMMKESVQVWELLTNISVKELLDQPAGDYDFYKKDLLALVCFVVGLAAEATKQRLKN